MTSTPVTHHTSWPPTRSPLTLLTAAVLVLVLPTSATDAEEGPHDSGADGAAIAERQIEQEQDFRETLGFRSDREFVRDTIERPDKHGSQPRQGGSRPPPEASAAERARYLYGTAGYHFTPDEAAEFQTRMRLQREARVLSHYGQADAPNEYAGLMLDHDAGGEFVAGFTRDLDSHVRELRERFSAPERIRVVKAPHSAKNLAAQRDRLEGDRLELRNKGIALQSTSLRWRQGAIVVGLDSPSDSKLSTLRQQYGTNIEIRAGGEGTPQQGSYDPGRDVYDPPMRGGIRLTGAGSTCTSAFNAFEFVPDGVDFHTLSAGHCWQAGTSVEWGGSDTSMSDVIGNAYENGTYSDSSYFEIASSIESRWI